jgi:hypothetical protein
LINVKAGTTLAWSDISPRRDVQRDRHGSEATTGADLSVKTTLHPKRGGTCRHFSWVIRQFGARLGAAGPTVLANQGGNSGEMCSDLCFGIASTGTVPFQTVGIDPNQ